MISWQMLENGSVMESRSSRLIDHDESTNKLEQVRRMGLRKLLKMYSSVNERLSSVGKKKLQLADLVINDHIPDMKCVWLHCNHTNTYLFIYLFCKT